MGRIIVFTILIIVVALGFLKFAQKKAMRDSADQGEQRKLEHGLHEFFISHGGMDRRYLVYLPVAYDHAAATPVILNLHGSGGNAESNISMTGMNETADIYGFIVVYPEGTGTTILGKTIAAWNTGIDERIADVDDVGFIAAVIEKVKTDFHGDSERIFATGISNGAQMAYRLACERADIIAAIAPVAAQGARIACSPSRPVPIIHFHGTDDPCALYDGGMCGGCIQKYFKEMLDIEPRQISFQCESVLEYIKGWMAINRLRDTAPYVFYENDAAQCIGYGKDDQGEIVLCTVKGMGHTWPGGTYGIPCKNGLDAEKCAKWISVVGALSNDIFANELMWEFFKKHPLLPSR